MKKLCIALPAALILASTLALPGLAAPGPGVKFPPKLQVTDASADAEQALSPAPHG
jgi:hypothetical protein